MVPVIPKIVQAQLRAGLLTNDIAGCAEPSVSFEGTVRHGAFVADAFSNVVRDCAELDGLNCNSDSAPRLT